MINDNMPVTPRNDNDINNSQTNKQGKTTGNGYIDKTGKVKYSQKSKGVNYNNASTPASKPNIDAPSNIINPVLIQKEIKDSQKMFSDVKFLQESFLKELNSGKVTPETKKQLKENQESLQVTKKYLNYLSGNNIDKNNPKAKTMILVGMGLDDQQIESVKALGNDNTISHLNKKHGGKDIATKVLGNDNIISFLNNKHGGADIAKEKVVALVAQGYSQEQAEAILALSPAENSQIVFPKSMKANDMLKMLGFNSEQVEKLNALKDNSDNKYPNQSKLLQKIGINPSIAKVLQAVADKNSLQQQENFIKSTNKHTLFLLDQIIKGYDNILNNKIPKNKPERDFLSVIYAMMISFMKSQAKIRLQERNNIFAYKKSAINAIKEQANLQKEAATEKLIADATKAGANIAAGLAQAKIATSKSAGGALQADVAKANAVAGVINGLGDLSAAMFNYSSAMTQAEIKDIEAMEKYYDVYAEEAKQFLNVVQSVFGDALSLIQGVERSDAETHKSINRG